MAGGVSERWDTGGGRAPVTDERDKQMVLVVMSLITGTQLRAEGGALSCQGNTNRKQINPERFARKMNFSKGGGEGWGGGGGFFWKTGVIFLP